MTMNPYEEGFKDWVEVQEEFKIDTPEPEEVLLAVYDLHCYEGYAVVFYREGDKYFEVQGSHCSCYGLEGQWDVEECGDKKMFIKALQRRDPAFPSYDKDALIKRGRGQ